MNKQKLVTNKIGNKIKVTYFKIEFQQYKKKNYKNHPNNKINNKIKIIKISYNIVKQDSRITLK